MNKEKLRIAISGGGTGGHVYPAIAIADAIKQIVPDADLLFVGANGKIEMEKVPNAGYPIKGLWISGLHRKLTFRNLLFPLKLVHSLFKSWGILRRFKPQVVVGVGGFASGPLLELATRMNIPTLIQEQNSYAGITNKLLAKKVEKICVAYGQMDRFFPKEKLILTGNPVRKDFLRNEIDKAAAFAYFGLDPSRKTIFVFGGSLGAASINRAIAKNLALLKEQSDVQLLWQVGKLYYEQYKDGEVSQLENVSLVPFVDRMDYAYGIADMVVCRAGAGTISELCLVGQAAILIPSPNVAEDHQTKNAIALVERNAALMIPDQEADQEIISAALTLLKDDKKRKTLKENILKMAKPDAAQTIAEEVLSLIN